MTKKEYFTVDSINVFCDYDYLLFLGNMFSFFGMHGSLTYSRSVIATSGFLLSGEFSKKKGVSKK
jgi:hypothetical protein